MSEIASTLNPRFEVPGKAAVIPGHGGLPAVRITTAHCTGEVYLLGGQVTRWKPSGSEEVLWLSQQSSYQVGKAIRGGIPVCFPWFGTKANAPTHGFARTRHWDLESINVNESAVTVTLLTRSDKTTKALWPSDFELRLHATFGRDLCLKLELTNTGAQYLQAEEALHSYFRVGDVRQCGINGLDNTTYLDKADSNKKNLQSGDIRISSETDRVYLNTTQTIQILDPVLRRRIHIRKENSLNSVVWNPWIDKARALSDFGNDEWSAMVCIEPSNIGSNVIQLPPGQQHTMAVHVSVNHM